MNCCNRWTDKGGEQRRPTSSSGNIYVLTIILIREYICTYHYPHQGIYMYLPLSFAMVVTCVLYGFAIRVTPSAEYIHGLSIVYLWYNNILNLPISRITSSPFPKFTNNLTIPSKFPTYQCDNTTNEFKLLISTINIPAYDAFPL